MENKKYLQTELRKKAEIKSLKEPVLILETLKSMSLTEIAEKMHVKNNRAVGSVLIIPNKSIL